jgi:hypothetical protein
MNTSEAFATFRTFEFDDGAMVSMIRTLIPEATAGGKMKV